MKMPIFTLGGVEMDTNLAEELLAFLERCRRNDGGYRPSPDPDYPGRSDTSSSDLAAPAYAAVIARTLGAELPDAETTVEFIRSRQRPDGAFENREGAFDPNDDLALLYNATQAAVSLRALNAKPLRSPISVMDRFFEAERWKTLPWYALSFFPLFYAALDASFPPAYRDALAGHMMAHQAEDGYLGGHVAAAFHMAHFFRLLNEPTPRASQMVERVLRDQTPEGGWDIMEPDWDVHAAFDAVFTLRQLGGSSERVREAIQKAADWALRCRNADGGFGHFPGWPSDLDATYFQFGVLWQAGRLPGSASETPDGHLLAWGHAMPTETRTGD
jgi:geranylgeranyl transferase type-2 subunit beta